MTAFIAFDLINMKRKDLLALYSTLQAPTLEEMHGDYRATMLDQGNWLQNFATLLAFNLQGRWISKAFRPVNATEGQGYNSFRIAWRVHRIYPMKTFVGPSTFDGKPAYHLDYRPLNQRNLPALARLTSELRRHSTGLYVGLGVGSFGLRGLHRFRPFLLEGPSGEFQPVDQPTIAKAA